MKKLTVSMTVSTLVMFYLSLAILKSKADYYTAHCYAIAISALVMIVLTQLGELLKKGRQSAYVKTAGYTSIFSIILLGTIFHILTSQSELDWRIIISLILWIFTISYLILLLKSVPLSACKELPESKVQMNIFKQFLIIELGLLLPLIFKLLF